MEGRKRLFFVRVGNFGVLLLLACLNGEAKTMGVDQCVVLDYRVGIARWILQGGISHAVPSFSFGPRRASFACAEMVVLRGWMILRLRLAFDINSVEADASLRVGEGCTMVSLLARRLLCCDILFGEAGSLGRQAGGGGSSLYCSSTPPPPFGRCVTNSDKSSSLSSLARVGGDLSVSLVGLS